MNTDMRALAATSGEFRTNLSTAALPTGMSDDMSAMLKELTAEKDLLDLKSKQLAVDKDRAPDKMARAAVQAQLDQINARKREIALQKEQIDWQKKYGTEVSATSSDYNSQISDLAKMPYNFAQASGEQFMSDLGIGGGALSGLAMKGLEYGSQFIFNVSNIDEAMAVQSNQQNRQALAATGR